MRVLHLSTFDYEGGAARAAYRLHHALLKDSVDSTMLVQRKSTLDSTVRRIALKKPASLIRRLLRERWHRHRSENLFPEGSHKVMWHGMRTDYRPTDLNVVAEFDVVHLHWTSGLLDWPSMLPWLAHSKPLVWTLHDMNPFLGVLHYDFESDRLPEPFRRFELASIKKKTELLSRISPGRIRFVAPSNWMQAEAQRSSVARGFQVDQVFNGVDSTIFFPISQKSVIKSAFGVPEGAFVVGFVAQNAGERRKGLSILMEALAQLELPNRVCLLIVGDNPPIVSGLNAISVGSMSGERSMNVFYNALDLFVCPSLADNLPNTILEAMATGTPTIGFEVGGLPDMVTDNETGWLVAPDARILCSAVGNAIGLDPADRSMMQHNCRRVAIEKFSLGAQAKRMRVIYESQLTADCS